MFPAPIFMIVMLTGLGFMLPVASGELMGLGQSAMVGCLFYAEYIAITTPSQSDTVPAISKATTSVSCYDANCVASGVMMPTLSSLVAPCGATSGDKFVIMTTRGLQRKEIIR